MQLSTMAPQKAVMLLLSLVAAYYVGTHPHGAGLVLRLPVVREMAVRVLLVYHDLQCKQQLYACQSQTAQQRDACVRSQQALVKDLATLQKLAVVSAAELTNILRVMVADCKEAFPDCPSCITKS